LSEKNPHNGILFNPAADRQELPFCELKYMKRGLACQENLDHKMYDAVSLSVGECRLCLLRLIGATQGVSGVAVVNLKTMAS
jgi:hypothetical protein